MTPPETGAARRAEARPARTTPTSPRRPVPAPERPRHLEVVRGRPAPGRRPPTLFVIAAVSATGIAFFALVMAQVVLGQAGFTQAKLQTSVDTKRAQAEQLELQVDKLRSPTRSGALASKLFSVTFQGLLFQRRCFLL